MFSKVKSFFYLFFPVIGGSVVGFIIRPFLDYSSLRQPLFSPPSFLFPIAWTIIYLLMGIAYYLYQKQTTEEKTILLYYLQLVVNYLWSIFFFVLKWRTFAFVWILLLIFWVILLMIAFFRKEKRSFYLLLPYLLWLFFATYLNLGIILLN